MERVFQADFSTVRLHEGAEAGAAGVRALARGEDVHVAPGALRPETEGGRELLGHELAHVLQQRAGLVGPGTAGALEAAAGQAGVKAARGIPVRSVGRDAAGPAPLSFSSPVLRPGPAQADPFKVGSPPPKGKKDNRSEVDAFHQGGDVYIDANANRYTLVRSNAGDYLQSISSQDTDPGLKSKKDLSMTSLLGGGRSKKVDRTLGKDKKKVLQRPLYSKAEDLTSGALQKDATSVKKIENILKLNDPRHPDFKKSKETQDRKIRDTAKKRDRKDKRGTGNDEGQQTFLFPTALNRDSGLSKDSNIRTRDTGAHGQKISRLQIHQYNRTPTRAIPLMGGPGHNHPGVATSTPGGKDHLSKGNADLDKARATAILTHHGPATEWGASTVQQVKHMKPPRDVINHKNVTGFDTKGRNLSKDKEARQDLTWESGRNRETLKRIAKKIPEEYPNLSPIRHEELSSDDEAFGIDPSEIDEAVQDPTKLPLVFSSFENPKPRPPGWEYKGKVKKKPTKSQSRSTKKRKRSSSSSHRGKKKKRT